MEPEEQIVARQLIIVDKQNRPRIQLGCSKNEDTPVINIRDEDGNDRLSLCLSSTGNPILYLLSPTQKRIVSFAIPEDGGACLQMHDDEERLRLSVAVQGDGSPSVILRDAEGKIRLSAFVNPKMDSPMIMLVPKGGNMKNGIQIALSADDQPGIFGVDSAGETRFELK